MGATNNVKNNRLSKTPRRLKIKQKDDKHRRSATGVQNAKKKDLSIKESVQPRVLDFDVRIPQPDASQALFHGMSALDLPSGSVIQSMPPEAQHGYFESVTGVCEKLIQLIDETVRTFSKTSEEVSAEEQLISDMVRLKNVPMARRYVDMTLWRRVKSYSRERLRTARDLGYGSGNRASRDSGALLVHSQGDIDPDFLSYRDAYLKTVIHRYEDDLNKIRESERLDAEQATFLMRCLESGADLFGNLKSLEKEEEKR
ncbi:hypothetical protein BWQ96_03963 [Gracilariopsis chorda]|uniref:Ribosome-assembly protein 3 C-terminal domain-containing protein n=1 Tax=Gracilariopsis chorda TaxID=448386 RepID=A0A2V3IX89_9FLOR|nr:hypothetical protein BWQ96_03963 [Gracilariopsis chorda]|eukprot:PXF46307.1 hypothetical protein BWQ96_03963 [Gracilariopsis chorda]